MVVVIRIAAVFILLFALLGVGSILPVYAQSGVPTQCAYGAAPGDAFFCNQQQAFERCTAMAEYGVSQSPHNRSARACVLSGSNRYFCSVNEAGRQYPLECEFVGSSPVWSTYWYFSDCDSEHPWDETTKTCKEPKDCSDKPDLGQSVYQGANADFQICLDGCRYDGGFCVQTSLDGGFTTACSSWHSSGQTCSFSEATPSPSDSDGDGSSDGNDSSPNNPGSGNPNQPQDGGGKGDGNSSGEGSGNGNTSGGGFNCSSPPVSSGDAILAQIAYQAWATRCAIEGAKDGNGNLKTSNGSSSGGGEGEGEGTNFGSSAPPADEPFDPSEHQRFGIGLNASMLDSEAIFGAGNCPVFTITIYQSTFSTSELPAWCDLLRVMRALVLLFGAFTALRILMGNNS